MNNLLSAILSMSLTLSGSLFSSIAFASGAAITPGIYDEKTGNTIQAYCMQWESDKGPCVQLQFFETTKERAYAISSKVSNNDAAQLGVPAGAPIENFSAKKPEAFAITKKAWTDGGGVITGSVFGSLTGAGLLAGAGVAMEVPGRPKISESDDLSENLPTSSNLSNFGSPIYSVYIVNEDVPVAEKAGGNWTTFFDHAKSMSASQRVGYFDQLFGVNSGSDPTLLAFFSAPTGYTLVRIEYNPAYTSAQAHAYNTGDPSGWATTTADVSNPINSAGNAHVGQHNYNFVFVANNDIAQYDQYIANKTAANAQALKWWRQDMYIYFGAVIGGSLLIAASPTLADFFRDLVAFPAYAAKKHRIQKENDKIISEWTNVWGNLFNKDVRSALKVSPQIYDAVKTTIAKRLPFTQ